MSATALEMLSQATISALELMRVSPKDIEAAIRFVAGSNDWNIGNPRKALTSHLSECGPNDRVRHALTIKMQQWDHEDSPAWSKGTEAHSDKRRAAVLKALGFDRQQATVINAVVPVFSTSEVPTVIASAHRKWYEAKKSVIRSYYWKHYAEQLARPRGSWSPEAVAKLDISTDDVLARISDPSSREIWQTKGLVMGYVQSGKTSHFGGLIAKAADAGYRLIIVLAGTLDILREQTQRRLDKEIVGKELLGTLEYGKDADWSKFVEHVGLPRNAGVFEWTRLTDRKHDYTKLEQHLAALEFKRTDPSRPFNDPLNLEFAPARLAVIKKNPSRIAKLCEDLERLAELRARLEHIPTLIIDDESDQASVNVMVGSARSKNIRSSTNREIGRLLKLLPSSQYVGYTATPFANVFIDPDDADDVFPKDFMVNLQRPEGYMGVADFYDFDSELPESDLRRNERAFVRSVRGENEAPSNLPEAIDAYVLSGAMKLYREKKKPGEFQYRHHTMLIHHSPKQVVHQADADVVRKLFGGGARYQKADGMRRLEKLFSEDFLPVTRARAKDLPCPRNFEELKPFISAGVSRICEGKSVLIVNGQNKDDTPDFDQTSVWAMIVGGAKLSRGYTVEGLTTSYFRRSAGAGSTLMQMGRWFGFRPGYGDLVRLYIGREEPRGKSNVDLYEAFGGICRDEESLRRELSRYKTGEITPKQVPPLVRQHLPYLPPESKAKMFNARIKSKNFSGDWTEKTVASSEKNEMKLNLVAGKALLKSATDVGVGSIGLTGESGVRRTFDAYVGCVSGASVREFLRSYVWARRKTPIRLEEEFIEKELKAGRLKEWTLLLPLIKSKDAYDFKVLGISTVSVIERVKDEFGRFKVYSEPRHRDVAAYLSGVKKATQVCDFLRKSNCVGRGVLVVYLVKEKGAGATSLPTIGFAVQYPGVKSAEPITWGVVSKDEMDAVVVDARQISEASGTGGQKKSKRSRR